MTQQTIVATRMLTKQFIEGLKGYNLTLEQIQNGDWFYCGGDALGRPLNKFKKMFPKRRQPSHKDKCVCGHDIKENCYITNGERFITLGNICIKKFIDKNINVKTCSLCNAPHKNIKVDRCNNCREGLCKICGETAIRYKKFCSKCKK
tara:strand:- start:168 stop:611 length:444 start_codon:yes stop_codon:yes gene_type:complete